MKVEPFYWYVRRLNSTTVSENLKLILKKNNLLKYIYNKKLEI